MTNAPYERGTKAKSMQTLHIAVTPRMLAAIEKRRWAVLESTGDKISRNDIIERAIWEYLARHEP